METAIKRQGGMSTVYSNLKILRYPDRLAAYRDRIPAAPVHVRIKPINRCNHNCWYCAYRADHLQLGAEMSEEDRIPEAKMFEIADDLVAMGVAAVTFSGGGEPLLYKALPDVIDRLAAGGIKVASLTNGTNLKGRMADAFARHGSWVRVSLDGWDAPSYAAARGVREAAFDQLLDNMRAFAARRSACVLGASFIISRDNYRHIAEICATLKCAGAAHVKLSGAVVDNDGARSNAYHAPIRVAVAEQIAAARRLEDDRFRIVDHTHALAERFEQPPRCPMLQFLTVIGADCRVYTCQDKAYTAQGCLGSIADRRFRSFWNDPETRARIYAFDPRRHCGHHCVAATKNRVLNDLLAIDDHHAAFV